MKKVLAFVLALVLTLTVGSVLAFAEEQPQIVVDGVKDAAYVDQKSLTCETWQFFENEGQNSFDPVDPERVMNTVWFNWDDESVYIYFQCESKDDLYKPGADVTELPDFDFGPFYEIAQIYLDTAPSLDWDAPCIWAEQNGVASCEHMACNCREGTIGSRYRLMARSNPAFDQWNDYYATASGMFMTYEEFCENYAGKEGYEDLAAKYAESHGNGEGAAVSFIDYETNVYGFEMKFPRAEGEEYFQFNIRTRVNETVWDEEGAEMGYSLSFCPAWWTNADGLFEIYFEDYLDINVDPAVAAIQRKIAELPAANLLEKDHVGAVTAILANVETLNEEQKAQFTKEELDWLSAAAKKVELILFIERLGDINEDDSVNATDALIALRAAVNKIELNEDQFARADVNGDQKVNAKDALEMLQLAVEKRTEFSIVATLK